MIRRAPSISRHRLFLSWCVAVFAAAAGSAFADGNAEVIRKKALEVGQAMVKQDYAKVADLTYHKVVQSLGGRDKMLQLLRDADKEMRGQGYVIRTVAVDAPGEVVKGGGELFCIVPVTLEMKVPKGTLTAKSFLLAISGDEGKSWSFVDGANVTPASAKQVSSNFPDALKLPEREKPVFTKDKTP